MNGLIGRGRLGHAARSHNMCALKHMFSDILIEFLVRNMVCYAPVLPERWRLNWPFADRPKRRCARDVRTFTQRVAR